MKLGAINTEVLKKEFVKVRKCAFTDTNCRDIFRFNEGDFNTLMHITTEFFCKMKGKGASPNDLA